MLSLALALLMAAAAREGGVVQATQRRAWLDAGSLEGLSQGQTLEVGRAGGQRLRCTIEWVSERRATCTGARLQPGDKFAITETAPVPRPEALRAPAKTGEVRAQEQAALGALGQPLVEFHASGFRRGLPGAAPRGEVALGHTSFLSTDAGPWHRERVDARIRGLPLGAGVSLWADLTALYWTRRPEAVNDQPGEPAQLHVWQAQATARSADRAWTASLGRLQPWFAPGATRIDGAQAGLRSDAGNEVGVFGGGVPDQNSLAPDFGSATGGLYWTVRGQPAPFVSFGQHQGRLALVSTPSLGQRVEAEGTVLASLSRKVDLGLDLRAGAGGSLKSGFEAVRVDATARPLEPLTIGAGFRWVGVDRPEYASTGQPAGGRSRSGDLSANWRFGDALVAGVGGGWSRDLQTGLERGWLGPDLTAPRVFTERLSLAFGWREELGWLPGRTGWLQASARPLDPFTLLARVAFSQLRRPDSGDDVEVGLFTRLNARLAGHWELRFDAGERLDPRSTADLAAGMRLDASLAGLF